MLRFTVEGQKLSRGNNPFIAADSIDYLEAEFAFSDEWSGLVKSATFTKGAIKHTIILTDDAILASDHLNLSKGIWYVSVKGVATEGETTVQRIPTNIIPVEVKESDVTGGETPPLTPLTFAEQLLAEAQQSLYELAVANGFEGTPEEWLETIIPEGDPGTSAYVYIKYAADAPTADGDMSNTPNAYIGIYAGTSATAPTAYTEYTWYLWKGPGVVSGGTTGKVLKKKSGADYDTEWWDILAIIAPEYSAASPYALGKFVSRAADGKFYECTAAIETQEEWNAGHWTERTIGYVLEALKALINGKAPIDGWNSASGTWTYASANTITVPSGAASIYSIGDSIRWKQGGAYKYGVISVVADTLLTIIVNTDYVVADAAITDNYYTHSATAVGLPACYNFTPTYENLTVGAGSNTGQYRTDGRKIEVSIAWVFGSGAVVSDNPKLTMPVAAAVGALQVSGTIECFDSSVPVSYMGLIRRDGYFKFYNVSGANILLGGLAAAAPFTWGANDQIVGNIVYSF